MQVIEDTVISRGVSIFIPQNAHVVHVNGRRFDSETWRLQIPGEQFCIASMDWHCWFSMFIPDEVIADWKVSETRPIRSSSCFIQLPSDRAAALRRAVVQLGLIVHTAPGAFESSAAVNATSRKLTELVREALRGSRVATPKPGRHSVSRTQIIQAVMDSGDQHDCEYLSVAD